MSFSPEIENRNKTSIAFAQQAARKTEGNYVVISEPEFMAQWKQPFLATGDAPFTQDDGGRFLVPMMRAEFEDDGDGLLEKNGAGYKAFAVEYRPAKEDTAPARYIVVIPTDRNVSARDWMAGQGDSPEWLDPAGYKPVTGTVTMPKFTAGSPPEPSPFASVKHPAYFKTGETGSEAAAVTTAMSRMESVKPPQSRLDLVLDRSFVFASQDIGTGALLSVGVVNDPERSKAPKPSTLKIP